MPTLERINVTPVKAMALLHPAEVEITANGIAGDRRFYLVDEAGGAVTGSECGPLVQIEPGYDPRTEVLTMRFPDGTRIEDVADRLGEAQTTDFYGRPVAAHEVMGPWNDALSEYAGRPIRLLRSDREGDGIDVLPLTIVSMASVDDLGARGYHDGPLDSRRFRINFELAGCEPYEEDSWDGGTLRIGEAEVRVQGAIPRCVITTQSPADGRQGLGHPDPDSQVPPQDRGRRRPPVRHVRDRGASGCGPRGGHAPVGLARNGS